MRYQIFWAGLAALALAGCGQGDTGNSAANAGEAGEAAGDPHGAQTDGPRLLLSAAGIMLDGTEQSMIGFGANSLDTIEQAIPVLGEIYDQDTAEDCGAGPTEFAMWDNVWLMFQQGEFVGWELREAGEEVWIGTPGGITIGSPRSELEAALGGPVTVEQSSVGTEFNGAGFTGLLSSDAPDATVTALWAGTSCAMR